MPLPSHLLSSRADLEEVSRRRAARRGFTTASTGCYADWHRLDLVKIDAEGAEALVWEGMQETLLRFPTVVVVIELHLQRDPPQSVNLLHQIERAGYALRAINYEGDVVPTETATILGQPQEHWTLWLLRG